jgi:hypothetical protein
MDDAKTLAWILYALDMASARAPADFRSISAVADGINHAVPTHKELQGSLSSLASAGLVSKGGGGYSLTTEGVTMVMACSKKSGTTMGVWHSLTRAIAGKVGCGE